MFFIAVAITAAVMSAVTWGCLGLSGQAARSDDLVLPAAAFVTAFSLLGISLGGLSWALKKFPRPPKADNG